MKNISYVFVLLASVLWASTAAVGKLLLTNLNNIQVVLYANLFAFLSLALIVLFQGKLSTIKTYTKKDYFTFAWMSFVGVFCYAVFLYGAIQLLPAQEAFIINYLWPVMVVVFAALILKEKLTWQKVLGILCSFIGVVIVVTKGDFSTMQFGSILGIVLAIAGAVVYGIFSVLGKKQNYDKFTSMMFYYGFSFVYAFIAVLLFSKIPLLSLPQLGGVVWLGIFTEGLGFVFWFLALKYGDTAKMSNMIFLTPFLSLVYIYFLVGEKILISSVVGLVVIVAGILIQSVKKKHENSVEIKT